ncbi:Ras-GAP domain-containing protein [Mycena chlorophos]|uniref:Ras-GAP domain-containing protein n=1 Tax=Mycena chlorophos TaxID=658473 RepID=A0A8H6WKR2_MYCCL|nr:Ras-GAP domain-containing protein [Mycena chlorophos]
MAFLRSYHHKHTLRVNGNVVILACSQIGRFLAAGGSEGTHVFDLQAVKKLDSPRRAGSRGSTTSLCFGRQLGSEVLYSGTSDGFVFVWRLRNDSDTPYKLHILRKFAILPWMPPKAHLSCAPGPDASCRISLSQHPVNGTWISVLNFSQTLNDLAPNRVMLTPSAVVNNPAQDISVFGFHPNGHVFTLDGATGDLLGKWPAGSQVSSLTQTYQIFEVDLRCRTLQSNVLNRFTEAELSWVGVEIGRSFRGKVSLADLRFC